ncbi:MAG: helix-turn-helix transcriptional regulator [Lachnospiraceae bacterium]|nr:helix-turn-helix transcriptional regulator [Lachnospiraceae bacterium]
MNKKKITDPQFVQERITELRLAREISEYRLSKDLGFSKGYIQSISSGKTFPSITALYEICDYFKITPKEFFDDGSAPDSELVHNLILEIRALPTEEQYFLYHFLMARRSKKSVSKPKS